MTRVFHLVSIILLLSVAFVSCKSDYVKGTGEVTRQKRPTAVFNKLQINVPVEATILVEEGSENAIEIVTYQNVHKHIKTEVVDNTLQIYTDDILSVNKDIEVKVTTAALTCLDITGSADASIKGDVQADNFELHVTGNAEVDIQELHTNGFTAKLSGSSEVKVAKGVSNHAVYKVTGSGDIDAEGLETKIAEAKVSGAGEMNLTVSDKLNAHITGAGKIGYKGHPKISSHISGAGSLTDKN